MSAFRTLREWAWIPIAVFAVLWIHGSFLGLGLTDDEAYYWVLAQRPALGYAFHPPVVAWTIALAQKSLGWLLGPASPALVRLPAALFAAGIVAVALSWMKKAGTPVRKLGPAGAALLSFAGIFGSAWMMVPDLPLLFGWILLFHGTWELCFDRAPTRSVYARLALGAALALLSKYSAVLALFSSGAALLRWSPPRVRARGLLAVFGGALIAAVPIIAWNSTHEWASVLYQIRERHGGAAISFSRYLRFWSVELVLAGPLLLLFGCLSLSRISRPGQEGTVAKYILLWVLPAALVFCLQPLWSDFKPHWAFVVWLPIALELGWAFGNGKFYRIAKFQTAYGLTLGALVLVICHVPVLPWVSMRVLGRPMDPRFDITNDVYGWAELPKAFAEEPLLSAKGLPVVGSRYQTAAQAAFALGDFERVTLIPRDLKQLDEWKDLGVADHQGPSWPRLLKPVLFVGDNRYDAAPAFTGARCKVERQIEKRRSDYLAKTIRVWRCDPVSD